MTIKPYGESAIFIHFEEKIDAKINAKVHQLNDLLKKSTLQGITFTIPAYCSLSVGFDKNKISFSALNTYIENLAPLLLRLDIKPPIRNLIKIPVCYDLPYSIDLEELSEILKLEKEKIIELHTNQIYQVFMIGFLPGFPYLGTLPPQLQCERKAKPRLEVPARSVGLAGLQTGIYPSAAPGGWQIIGRTPIPVFNPQNEENMFLLKAGDEVQFYPISKAEFEGIREKII